MDREEHSLAYLDDSNPIRGLLRENQVGEWSEVLESHGVYTVGLLRKVKYADLVQYGITEFEPRRKIFELIKRINTQMSSQCTMQRPLDSAGRPSLGLKGQPGTLEPMTPIRPGRVSVPWGEYSPQSTLWKRKRDMVDEIMEEAENSIIEEAGGREGDSIIEDSHLSMASEASILSNSSEPWLSNSLVEGNTNVRPESYDGSHNELGNSTSMEVSGGIGSSGMGSGGGSATERITVLVRKRPMKRDDLRDAIMIDGSEVILTEHKQRMDLTPYVEPHTFLFDRAFDERASTMDIYRESIRGLVDHTLSGGSSTCIAYGQTGSGKTYTMLEETKGVIPLAIKDLLAGGEIKVSFYEIYSNHIYDLLDKRKRIFAREKEGVVSIVGIQERVTRTITEAMHWIQEGNAARSTGRTGANTNSSRSHALFRVRSHGGIFTFVDLAGSERGSERALEGQQLLVKREGAEINKSLLALKECIRAMDRSATHLPFRHSKLTQVLKESLIGNSKCCIIATVSPESTSSEHTLNTLRYAYRIREIGQRSAESRESLDGQRGQKPSTPPRGLSQRPLQIPRTPTAKPNRPAADMSSPQRSLPSHLTTPGAVSKRKAAVQQALAAVAARVARETDVDALDWLKNGLLGLVDNNNMRYQK
ncbi:kinesin family member 2/24 [Nematocida homosporus]|uniref:kinesin family member 2/24 n=1 Tax=Nematocida homosporus TaxID=1912981 RepID=UPI00221E4067|nr:kinesin family member 2/24 [Nematocida homosporus]KAI5185644.1 kinesin family member 2/24 [Nematocida homosporus]